MNVILIARIIPRPIGARKFTVQFAKYPFVLYLKSLPNTLTTKLRQKQQNRLVLGKKSYSMFK